VRHSKQELNGDDFNTVVPVVSQHDTWVSIDPILGCPASCSYCYLHSQGLTGHRPRVRVDPTQVLKMLEHHFQSGAPRMWGGGAWSIPVCIGNYTDMFISKEGRNYLLDYLKLHAEHFPDHPLVVITKSRLESRSLEQMDDIGHPVLVFLSQSFAKASNLSEIERGAIATPADTTQNAELINRTQNLHAIHFWRPITSRVIPTVDLACRFLEPLQRAGMLASVAIGLKGGTFLEARTEDNQALLGNEVLPSSGEYIPSQLEELVLETGHRLDHPVYRHTSCAVALVMERHEALGTWRRNMRKELCEPCFCPDHQRARCDQARTVDSPPSEEILSDIRKRLMLSEDQVFWDSTTQVIRVKSVLNQEIHTRLTHLTGFRVLPNAIRQTRAWIGNIGPQWRAD